MDSEWSDDASDDAHMTTTSSSPEDDDSEPEPDWHVCEVCSGFGEEGHPRGFFFPASEGAPRERAFTYFYLHYPTLGLLSASSEAGCQVCRLILRCMRKHIITDHGAEAWDSLFPEEVEDSFDYDKDTADIAARTESARRKGALLAPYPDTYGAGRLGLYAFYETDHKGPRGTAGPQRVYPEIIGGSLGSVGRLDFLVSPADPLDPDFSHRPSTDVLSQPHVDLVRRWRDECALAHPACQRIKLEQQLPTRVLEIPPSSRGQAVDNCKVVETRGRKGVYAALSYCWGTTPQLEKTTTRNLARHLDRIPLAALPSTIADAIHLCHELGFRHVWVDALCIVQDDPADWAREAAAMCDVYGNAALTLVTSLVGDSSESFVAARRDGAPSCEPGAEIPFAEPVSGLPGSLWFYDDLFADGPWVLENDWEDISGRDRDPHEWLGRAWCFQEWILSPRILHVHEQTLWDCFEGYASETSCRHVGPTKLRRDLRGPSSSSSSSPGGQFTAWSKIVSEFTSRAITKESDRLPALAGLAAAYANATGRRHYLAGLWLEDLPAELLWHRAAKPRDDNDNDAHRGATPSFTWVSLGAPVNFYDIEKTYRGDFELKCSVVSWSCHDDDDDDGAPVYTRSNAATIDLEGPLSRVTSSAMPRQMVEYDKWTASFDREESSQRLEADIAQGRVYLLLVVGGHHFFGYYEWCALILLRKVQDEGSEHGKEEHFFRRLGGASLRLAHYDKKNPPAMPPATAECDASWEQRIIRLE